MTHVKVFDVMSTDVASVREDASFHEIVSVLADREISAVPVVDAGGRVLGVVSEADLLYKIEFSDGADSGRLLERRARRHARRKAAGDVAADLMTAPAVTVPAGSTVVTAAQLLESNGVKRMPVVDDLGRLAGVVSRRDLLKVFLRSDTRIRDEVVDEVLGRVLWIAPSEIAVRVDGGVVTLEGELEQRSLVSVVLRFVRSVDGVVDVIDRLTYRIDDTSTAEAQYYRPLV